MTDDREGVAIFFVNPRGEVLLRLRGDDAGLAFPNQWDTIGGAVEPGERHEEAAVRETLEEIGLELTGHVYWCDYQSVVLLHIYAAPLDLPEDQIRLTEGQRVGWFDLESALEQALHPWVAAVLPEFFASDVYRQALARAGM
jgi:8-oxo-dGTP pyrophosphatase MutT (NUDIX family)